MKIFFASALRLASLLLGSGFAMAQGPLTPSGVPAPTMKALDEIEPRINIQRTINPLPNDASYHYIISAPGSYYLSANLGVTKPNGINVTVAGVTIDLNGFQISRSSGSGGDGITIGMTAHRCAIRNGGVSGFANGVFCVAFQGPPAHGGVFSQLTASGCSQTGIRTGDAWQLEGCQAHDNLNTGISTGWGSTLANCTAYGNQVYLAIVAGWGCTLTNCAAYNNQVTYAIFAGVGSTLINCSARGNTGGSLAVAIFAQNGSALTNCAAGGNQVSWGIRVDEGSTLTNCSAIFNTSAEALSSGILTGAGCNLIGCTSNSNTSTAVASITTGMGIDAGTGSTVKNCTATSNKADGIRVAGSCLVTGCNSSQNGVGSAFGDGIRTTGDNNRIDGNLAVGNSLWGIRSSATNFITRNTVSGNATANYNPDTGTNIGPIQTPNTATSPWANF